MSQEKEIQTLLEKVSQTKKGELDLSSDEDLSIAIMNLIFIEEHFFFTAAKTGKSSYYDLLNQTREIRKSLLKRIIGDDYEGEVWCISKHLLAASMRLIEVGTKQFTKGDKKEAQVMFEKAYDLYSLFWGLNLKAMDIGEVKKIDDRQLDVHDDKKDVTAMTKLRTLVGKVLDCCRE
jgi:hypothetical protein